MKMGPMICGSVIFCFLGHHFKDYLVHDIPACRLAAHPIGLFFLVVFLGVLLGLAPVTLGLARLLGTAAGGAARGARLRELALELLGLLALRVALVCGCEA